MCPVLLSSGRVQPSTLPAPSALLRTVVTVGGKTWLALGRSPLYHSAYNWDPHPPPPHRPLKSCLVKMYVKSPPHCISCHHSDLSRISVLSSWSALIFQLGLLLGVWGGMGLLAVCFVRSQIFPQLLPVYLKLNLNTQLDPTRHGLNTF